jgi:hypothetical protein
MNTLSASSAREKAIQRGESPNLGRLDGVVGVGDDPRGAGGGFSAARSSAILLGYSAFG